ncbi:hypothetical protein [Trebonia sp.]|uniref:hypothetical protein n=1 Tax=Trebonia sp. TaxID=2767075 RepID=UPI00263601C7|nr:hypothetical protein [Trebonia sp.]
MAGREYRVRDFSGRAQGRGVTAPYGTRVCQHPTHAELIGPAQTPSTAAQDGVAPDAIIVPASRPAENLQTAIGLAEAANCHLVLLCSFQAHTSDVRDRLAERSFHRATVIQIPAHYRHAYFEFRTTYWVDNGPARVVCAARYSDLSIKRNIGLVLARMLGWQRVLFLDDDIRKVSAAALAGTVSLLGAPGRRGVPYRTAGMTINGFPDNSVVCHARRCVGEDQDVFVTGSVLAVDSSAPFGFFPDIYNEDWLFFYHDAAEGRLASSDFQAEQVAYNPFADPRRAAAQEFGDVIAEGLYALLHSKLGVESADHEYWRMFLADRNRVLDEIVRRLPGLPQGREDMEKAINGAREKLDEIRPDMCAGYLKAWQSDLERWEVRLAKLPRADSVRDAVDVLRLPLAVWATFGKHRQTPPPLGSSAVAA